MSLEAKNGINGTIYKFDSLDKLSSHFGVPASMVTSAADDYNKMVKAGRDSEFGKDIAAMKGASVLKAPFYGMIVNPRITYSPGGVKISTKAEVISIDTGFPIKGCMPAGRSRVVFTGNQGLWQDQALIAVFSA